MAGSSTRRRNRANPDTVPPAAPPAPPMTINVGTSAPAPVAAPTLTLAPLTAEVQAAEADLRATMTRLLGSSSQGGQIIAKRVVGAEERWLCNMGTAAWDEAAFATRFGAGSFALYIYGPDGSPRGRIPWAVDDSVGAGQPPPGANLAANQPRNAEAQQGNGSNGLSENALLMMLKTMSEANTALMSKLADMGAAKKETGFGFEQYLALKKLEQDARPKLSDVDGMLSLGLKLGAAANGGEAPIWASVLEGMIPVLEPISRACSIRLAGGGAARAAFQQRPQLGRGGNVQKSNGQAQGASAARLTAGGQRTAQAQARSEGGAGVGSAPANQVSGAAAGDDGAGAGGAGGHGGDSGVDGDNAALKNAEDSLRIVLAMLLKSQPTEGEEDERDVMTYTNILVDALGLDDLAVFASKIPEGSLAELLVLQMPQLKPSMGLIEEMEKELRTILAEDAKAQQDENPIAGNIGAPATPQGASTTKAAV